MTDTNVVSVGPKPGFYNIIHSDFQNCLKYKLVNGHDESEGIVVAADGDDGNLGWANKWEFTQLGNGRYHIKNCGINRHVTCPKPAAAGVRVECHSRFEKYQFDVRPVGGGEEYSIETSNLCWTLADGENDTPVTLAGGIGGVNNRWILKLTELK